MRAISIKVEDELYSRLKEAAERSGVTMSDVVRGMLAVEGKLILLEEGTKIAAGFFRFNEAIKGVTEDQGSEAIKEVSEEICQLLNSLIKRLNQGEI